MSAEDDNPLVGWSRRKRAARKESAARSVPAPSAEGEAERHAAPEGRRPPEASPAGQDAPAPPPPLGDLTPEHDLSAFLQKGIPESLKNAALRKMWSLDPAIRDHVGLAENDWDFTRPDTIPGFGSIAGSTAAPDFFSTPQPDRPLAAEAPVGSVRPPEAAEAHERIE
jgi:hypothetical protein